MPHFPFPAIGRVDAVWAAGALLGEGLCWSPSRRALYWLDVLSNRLMRHHPDSGARHTWQFGDTISAVAERSDGLGLVLAMRKGPAWFDPDTGALQSLHVVEHDVSDNRFNDGKCDERGRFWAGTMDMACREPTGSLYCLQAHGDGGGTRLHRAWDARFAVTNGPAWSLDGRTMWVNDTARGVVHAGDFDADSGTLSSPRAWLRFAAGDGHPDGMNIDALGRLWIAHWGGACVTCHAPDDGRELARVALPTRHITNVCFGGDDLDTLFVSSALTELSEAQRAAEPWAGALFAIQTDARGLPAHRFAI